MVSTVAEVRRAIADLEGHSDKNLIEAGRCLGAAFGALALARRTDGDERALRVQQASLLLARGMTAWLRFASTAAGTLPPELQHISGAFRALCDEGSAAIAGDSNARAAFDQRLSGIRKQIARSN